MNPQVDLDDLLAAFEWVSAADAAALDCSALVSRATGAVHWCGEGVDDEIPADIEDGGKYLALPHRSEFELGRALALRFVEERLPDAYERVQRFFHSRGAYARFKAELARVGQLEPWHADEQQAVEAALSVWAEEAGFAVVRGTMLGVPRR